MLRLGLHLIRPFFINPILYALERYLNSFSFSFNEVKPFFELFDTVEGEEAEGEEVKRNEEEEETGCDDDKNSQDSGMLSTDTSNSAAEKHDEKDNSSLYSVINKPQSKPLRQNTRGTVIATTTQPASPHVQSENEEMEGNNAVNRDNYSFDHLSPIVIDTLVNNSDSEHRIRFDFYSQSPSETFPPTNLQRVAIRFNNIVRPIAQSVNGAAIQLQRATQPVIDQLQQLGNQLQVRYMRAAQRTKWLPKFTNETDDWNDVIAKVIFISIPHQSNQIPIFTSIFITSVYPAADIPSCRKFSINLSSLFTLIEIFWEEMCKTLNVLK